MWRAIKVDPTMFEFIYHECFRVSIPCIKFRPVMNKITVTRVEDFRLKFKDAFPQLSDFLLHMAKEWIISSSIALNAPEVNPKPDRIMNDLLLTERSSGRSTTL